MEKLRFIKQEDKKELKELWKAAFGDSETFIDWFFEYRFIPTYSVCLEKDGQIVSALHSNPVHVSIRNKILYGAIVAGCVTKKGFEKKGYMKLLFSYYMNEMRKKGVVVTPHTPQKLTTFYKMGHYPVADAAFLDIEKVTAKKDIFQKEFVTIKEHNLLDELLVCYQETAVRYSGMISRSLADFRLKASDYRADGGKCIAYVTNSIVRGYFYYFDTPSLLHVEELIAETPEIEQQLVEYAASLAEGRSIHIKLPFDSCSQIGGVKACAVPHSVMGVTNVEMLLDCLGSESIPYIIEIKDDIVKENEGIYTMKGKKVQGNPKLKIETGRFLQWICGYCSLAQLEERKYIEIFDHKAAEELDRMFPTLPCRIIDEY